MTFEEKREWLVFESLWASLKSPIAVQVERKTNHPAHEDPQGVFGLVMGSNLHRASLAVRNAGHFGSHDLTDADRRNRAKSARDFQLTYAAMHLGKCAGGLVSHLIALDHRLTPTMSFRYLIPGHIVAAQQALSEGYSPDIKTLAADPDALYDELTYHTAGFREGDRETVAHMASLAASSWSMFIDTYSSSMEKLTPGGTPRSAGGDVIDGLQDDFRAYTPEISAALAEVG